MRRLWLWGALVGCVACAPLQEDEPIPVVVEPIVTVEPILQRSEPCPDEPDDGIGGTGCEPVVD